MAKPMAGRQNSMDLIKKLFGWALLFAGLIIIIYGLYSSYNIFTAKTPAPELFKAEKKAASPLGGEGIETQLQGLLQDQLSGILPANSFPAMMNLVAWSVFAGILVLGGGQISGIGIKLLK